VGLSMLVFGFLPVWLLLVRRPEDTGLDVEHAEKSAVRTEAETQFTRADAIRTRAEYRPDKAPFSSLGRPAPVGLCEEKRQRQARGCGRGRRNRGRQRVSRCQPGSPSPRSGPCQPLRAADRLPRPGADRSNRGNPGWTGRSAGSVSA
jgi:hypothetical protein